MNRWRFMVLAGFIIAALLSVFAYLNSYQELSIDVSGEEVPAINIYKTTFINGEDFHSEEGDLIETVTASTTLRLKKGDYILENTNTQRYAEWRQEISLGDEALTVRPDLSLSESTLLDLLKIEQPKIREVLTKAYGKKLAGFNINKGRLFGDGEWYGTTIVKKLSPEEARQQYVDIYRIVLFKEKGSWSIETDYPQLLLNRHVYPGVPEYVLSQTNNMGRTN